MTKTSDTQTIHIVCGPTAGGKSAKAIALAEELDGVIINCDSMQIYSDLPILTAQPSEEDKAHVPHKLYATLHPNDPCSAGNWRELAEPVIKHVLDEGKTPIICGGTGLYIKALTDGLSPMPDISQAARDAANAKQKELGNPAFHEELKKRDPIMAERFHAHHTARLIRAWEVLEDTGKSLAEWQKAPRIGPPDHWRFEIHKILPEREILRERCDQRFELMLEHGALEEVEAFGQRLETGEIHHNIPLAKALGFKPLYAYIKGEQSKEDAIAQAQAQTRQYAKRQTTWFRNQL